MHRRIVIAFVVLLAGGLVWLLAQQPGGKDDIVARSAADIAYQKVGATLPGGTPEENLWETLVLMGAGDQTPATWTGSLTIAAGDLFAVEGYRFELPDRILPQGGWEMQTRLDTILDSSPIEG